MTYFIIGLVVFFGIHSVSIFALPLRNRLAEKSEYAWKGIYSLVSLAGLALLIKGYADYRLLAPVYYVPPLWLRHVSALLLLPIFVLMLAPFFPSRINKLIRHPMVTAVKLWAAAHLLVNGSLADIILFGTFLAWAVMVRISYKHRPLREVPHVPENRANPYIVIIGGLLLYVVFSLWLHGPLIGVRPFNV